MTEGGKRYESWDGLPDEEFSAPLVSGGAMMTKVSDEGGGCYCMGGDTKDMM